MDARDIDILVDQGFWIQVSPLANAGSGWICGVYKRGKKQVIGLLKLPNNLIIPMIVMTGHMNL